MDYKEVDKLLGKYFDGISSLEEEQALRYFFASQDKLKPEWQHAKAMLAHFESEKEVTFETPIRQLQDHRKQINLWRLSGIAASLLILVTAGWFYLRPMDEPVTYAYVNGKAVTEKAVALEEMRKALTLMSDNLSQGTNGLGKLSKLEQIRRSVAKKKQ